MLINHTNKEAEPLLGLRGGDKLKIESVFDWEENGRRLLKINRKFSKYDLTNSRQHVVDLTTCSSSSVSFFLYCSDISSIIMILGFDSDYNNWDVLALFVAV